MFCHEGKLFTRTKEHTRELLKAAGSLVELWIYCPRTWEIQWAAGLPTVKRLSNGHRADEVQQVWGLGMIGNMGHDGAHTLNPSAPRQRQVALHECQAYLVYIVSSREPCLKTKQTITPNPRKKIKIQTTENLQNKMGLEFYLEG